MPYAAPDSCGICQGDINRRRFVESELAKGTPHLYIERESKARKMPVKRETIRRHVRVCVPAAVAQRYAEENAIDRPKLAGDSNADFAQLVKDEAVRRLQAGVLKPSTKDGLLAQSLLDRRIEKAKDRDLQFKLGLLLAGYNSPPPVIIEGDYTETALLEAGNV